MGGAEIFFIETDLHWSLPTRSCLYWVYCRLYITGKESDTGSHSHMIASDLCIDSPYNINGRLFWKSCTFGILILIIKGGSICKKSTLLYKFVIKFCCYHCSFKTSEIINRGNLGGIEIWPNFSASVYTYNSFKSTTLSKQTTVDVVGRINT
jgi:hypothetical protein